MNQIVEIQLNQLAKRLEDREVTLKWDDKVVDHLAEKGYDPAFGARPLKRLIQHEVVNQLSKATLEGKIPAKSVLTLVMDGDKVSFTTKNSK